jgi:Domain of unknown function (DUF4259)
VGAWDIGPFDSDAAADWSGEFSEASDAARLEMLEEALRAAADETDYLDADVAYEAIAAAAVVASRLPGGPAVEADLSLDAEVPSELADLARRALERILDEDSAWRDRWDEQDRLDDAVAALEPIRSALSHD